LLVEGWLVGMGLVAVDGWLLVEGW
jgi:hypothetical protein